ncbi:MAG: septal ring lytic transglycosylase RlpA family protein [Akkermansiaceae bacterium]|nr:septal ring lytic transglycosylase RlpA family protein [Akkermansiaceae bacterium]
MIKWTILTALILCICGCNARMLSSSNEGTGSPLNTELGIASWYNTKTNHGTHTASGRPLNDDAHTAAHKKWPMGSQIKVTNLSNGRSELLTVTDRGPYIKGRIIDVTSGSAKRLGFYDNGIARTKVELLSRGNWKYQH